MMERERERACTLKKAHLSYRLNKSHTITLMRNHHCIIFFSSPSLSFDMMAFKKWKKLPTKLTNCTRSFFFYSIVLCFATYVNVAKTLTCHTSTVQTEPFRNEYKNHSHANTNTHDHIILKWSFELTIAVPFSLSRCRCSVILLI